MKTTFKSALLLLTILFIGYSCKKDSSKIDQSKIFQKYSVSYNEFTNVTTVKANFYEEKDGGKTLELSGESNVTVNGTKLSYSAGTYSTQLTGVVASVDFIFTDADKKTFANSIVPASYVGSTSSGYIDNGALSYWYFSDAVENGEEVAVTVANLADKTKTITSRASTAGVYKVSFAVSSISTIPAGDASVNISRSRIATTGNFTTVGGSITNSYIGLEKLVTVY